MKKVLMVLSLSLLVFLASVPSAHALHARGRVAVGGLGGRGFFNPGLPRTVVPVGRGAFFPGFGVAGFNRGFVPGFGLGVGFNRGFGLNVGIGHSFPVVGANFFAPRTFAVPVPVQVPVQVPVAVPSAGFAVGGCAPMAPVQSSSSFFQQQQTFQSGF